MRHVDDGTLNAWLDGALAGEEAEELREHLAACRECGARFEHSARMRERASAILSGALPAAMVAPPFDTIRARAEGAQQTGTRSLPARQGRRARPRGPAWLPAPRTLAWAASIVVALGAGWWAYELTGPTPRGQMASSEARRGSAPAVQPALPTPEGLRPGADALSGTTPRAPVAAPSRMAGAGGAEPRAPAGRDAARDVAREEAIAEAAPPEAAASQRRALKLADAAALDTTSAARGVAPAGKAVAAPPTPAAAPAALAAVPRQVLAPDSLSSPGHQARADAVTNLAQRASGRERVLGVTAQNVEAAPTFTPYTVAPQLLNRDEVRRALVALYPPIERTSGVGGTTMVWLLLDERGTVQRALVKQPSGHPNLDAAALLVARVMRFSPGLNRGQPVKVWVAVPITFKED